MSRVSAVGTGRALGAIVATVFAGGFVLVYYVTVLTVSGRSVSDASLRGALSTNTWLARVVSPVLSVVSVASLSCAVALVAIVALLRQQRGTGIAAVAVLVGSNVSTLVLKRWLLNRPDFGLPEATPATLNSLPSGHTTAAFSAVVALLFVLPFRWRTPVALLGGGYAVVTAVATMSAGWHRAGDSMAAFLLVGFWAALAAAAGPPAGPSEHPAPTDRPRSDRRWLAASGAGLLGLGVAMAFALSSEPSVRRSPVGPPLAFMAGGLLIAGVAAAVLLGVLRLLDLSAQETRHPGDRLAHGG